MSLIPPDLQRYRVLPQITLYCHSFIQGHSPHALKVRLTHSWQGSPLKHFFPAPPFYANPTLLCNISSASFLTILSSFPPAAVDRDFVEYHRYKI